MVWKNMDILSHSKSVIYIGDASGNFQNRKLALLDPSAVLQGDTPRLIDEWQEVPALWDGIRSEVDKRGTKGQFILTGSSTPNKKGVLHSGVGRIHTVKMRPMSLYESNDSNGDVSLLQLFDNQIHPKMAKEITLDALIELVVRGGWPGSLALNNKYYREYLSLI